MMSESTSLVLYAHDYTQGYGSFDFVPYRERWVQAELRPIPKSQTTTEPFPFMRLPLDIRDRIYVILISDMFTIFKDYCPKLSVAPRIHFTLRGLEWYPGEAKNGNPNFAIISRYPPGDPRNDPDHFLNLYKGLADETISRTQFNPAINWRDFKITEEEEEEQEYDGEETDSDESDSDDEATDDHHVREHGFRLEIDCEYSAEDGPRRVFFDYEKVRRFAYVSRQFSREIGANLWHNSVLQLEDLNIPVVFIKNRPAALQHVKGIVLNLDYYGSSSGSCLNSSTPDLEELVSWMSRNLELRFLMVNLHIPLSYINDITSKGLLPEWERIFRSAEVMERFHVRITSHQYPPSGHVLEGGGLTDSKENLEGIIRDLWMPDCLREATKTEKASYIQSRTT